MSSFPPSDSPRTSTARSCPRAATEREPARVFVVGEGRLRWAAREALAKEGAVVAGCRAPEAADRLGEGPLDLLLVEQGAFDVDPQFYRRVARAAWASLVVIDPGKSDCLTLHRRLLTLLEVPGAPPPKAAAQDG